MSGALKLLIALLFINCRLCSILTALYSINTGLLIIAWCKYIFSFLGEILCCGHSNEISPTVLLRGTFSSLFSWKMIFLNPSLNLDFFCFKNTKMIMSDVKCTQWFKRRYRRSKQLSVNTEQQS